MFPDNRLGKMFEEGDRENRDKEIMNLQRKQTQILKKQSYFNSIIAITGSILAIISILTFLANFELTNLTSHVAAVVFLILGIIVISFLITFVAKHIKKI